jgi:hypothetical protein
MRRVLELIYSDILGFHKQAIRFFSGRGSANSVVGSETLWLMYIRTVWRQVFRSVWKDFKTKFQHILDGLRDHRELIESQAKLLHFQQYQRDSLVVLDHVRQYQHDRLIMREKLESWENDERHKKYIAVMEWVAGAQTKLDHDSACDVRSGYPQSGRWILKKPDVENWRAADTPMSSILWLKGNPGAGRWT